jgi:hypothetical protein
MMNIGIHRDDSWIAALFRFFMPIEAGYIEQVRVGRDTETFVRLHIWRNPNA